ncbi:2OG-Fe(II) oxygenase [Qipengyuania aquimaris]|uniref:2OG-Fe(II) oxygenase n=1 Tax=Qipengyuania aquimaris TaxID=255984 RepID=UPI001CD53AC7|nr:2OG-Fe(II) oxygenase [Qipengyuania aquimaris]MCA0904303.1 2OG-Fe(II) oxygenase [Qipengyuania aquimaris]
MKMDDIDRTFLARLIASRLREVQERAAAEFATEPGVASFVVDDLLPEAVARKVFEAFPPSGRMRFRNSIKERKYIAVQMNEYNPLLEEAVYAFQAPEVVQAIKEITGFATLEPDEFLYAGGVSAMPKGAYLKPHLDNSHDAEQQRYRALNLLFYVTPNWQKEFGGNFELWDEGPKKKPRTIVSQFNRLVVMLTNDSSWHGVSEVTAEKTRCCVSNYYFSTVPVDGKEFFHATSFRGRPGERLKDLVMAADNALRTMVLKVTGTKLFKNPHFYRK